VSYHYDFFGYSAVSNAAIPGLTAKKPSAANIAIHFGLRPPDPDRGYTRESLIFESSFLTNAGRPSLRIFSNSDATLTHIIYDDGMEFWLDESRHEIWSVWPEPLTLADAATYLLGPVFGVLLRLKGTTCLHASAVAIGGKAVLFTGDAGAGKSTTAAALAQRGHLVLSDDIVPLAEREGNFIAVPAYSYLSLWPESVKMLYGPDAALPEFSKNFTKQQLALEGKSDSSVLASYPVAAIFAFGARSSEDNVPRVENMSQREGLLALIANSYASRILDIEKRAKEFEVLGRVARSVPVQRLLPHSDPAYLKQLCDVVETASQRL
jgi:hypothetical protein